MRAPAKARVQTADFNVSEELAALTKAADDPGAVVNFVGYVRGDDGVGEMTLEHYPGMTEQALEDVIARAHQRFPDLAAARIVHRVGPMAPGDQIVLAAAASKHRHTAFEAAAFLMDYLKTDAPFWKKESTPTGGRWVDARESDQAARARWDPQAKD